MELKYEDFINAFSLTTFVKNNHIQRENIQTITEIKGRYYLFYWE